VTGVVVIGMRLAFEGIGATSLELKSLPGYLVHLLRFIVWFLGAGAMRAAIDYMKTPRRSRPRAREWCTKV
jgi:hypothetical protein